MAKKQYIDTEQDTIPVTKSKISIATFLGLPDVDKHNTLICDTLKTVAGDQRHTKEEWVEYVQRFLRRKG